MPRKTQRKQKRRKTQNQRRKQTRTSRSRKQKQARKTRRQRGGDTFLNRAIRNNWSRQYVYTLIQSGYDVNKANNKGETPLYIACETNQLEIVKLLLDKGADVNLKPRLKMKTPLFLACENENLEMVNLLLEKDADVKLLNDDLRSDEKDISPLFKACETGNIYIAKRLLDEDADLKIKVSYYPRRTAFFIACTHNKTEIVKLLIETHPKKLNTDDFCVQKALHEACRENCVNFIKFLLSKTETFNIIDLNKIDDYYKFSKFEIPDNTHDTPLYAACKKGHNKIVELLLAKGADVNKVNTNTKEDTPLYAACEEGHNEIVELLLDKEANVNHVNNDNKYTPLSIA